MVPISFHIPSYIPEALALVQMESPEYQETVQILV